jgi:hypothetical protein
MQRLADSLLVFVIDTVLKVFQKVDEVFVQPHGPKTLAHNSKSKKLRSNILSKAVSPCWIVYTIQVVSLTVGATRRVT